MWKTILGAAIGRFLSWLVGVVFPSAKSLPPEAEAQKQKDRADALQDQLDAKIEGDAERDAFARDLDVHPERLREHDAFEVDDRGRPVSAASDKR